MKKPLAVKRCCEMSKYSSETTLGNELTDSFFMYSMGLLYGFYGLFIEAAIATVLTVGAVYLIFRFESYEKEEWR